MRKGVKTNILLLIMLVVLVACSLTACGLLTPVIVKVTEVSIAPVGLEANGEQYNAQIGNEFILVAEWNKSANVRINPTWSLTIDGEATDLGEDATNKEISYTIDNLDHNLYIFSLVINGVESSNTIKVTPKYASLDKVKIESNKPIVQDVIQMSKYDYQTINLSVSWNEEFLDPTLPEATISWKKDEVEIGTSKSIIFTPNDSWEPTTGISVEVTHNGITKVQGFTIEITENFLCVDDVKIQMYSGADEIGTTGQYVVLGSNPYPSVTINAVVTPAIGTDLSRAAKWNIRTKDGPSTALETGRTLTFNPTYGENIITCTIDNVTSYSFVVIALPSSEYTARELTIKDTFEWNGNKENHYITDVNEMADFLNYLIETRNYNSQTVYYAQSTWRANITSQHSVFKDEIMHEVIDLVEEAGQIGYSISGDTQFALTNSSVLGDPQYSTTAPTTTQNTNMETHYKDYYGITTTRTDLPCYHFTKTMNINSTNQLYRALTYFYKPIITDPSIQAVYDAAVDVLRTICDNEMTEYQKVLAIYDWIVTNVVYDTKLYKGEIASGTNGIDYKGYFVDGVFMDHKAVCDGKAKAFSMLCGMEGIRSVRVTGDASQPANPENKSGHAWNKVLIDIDGDGIREWYVIDSTWGDRTVKYAENDIKENLSYTYFLLRDSDVSSTHEQNAHPYPVANTTYDYYANATVNSSKLKVTTEGDLIKVLEYYADKVDKSSDKSYSFEIEVNILGINTENDLAHLIRSTMSSILYHDPNGHSASAYSIMNPIRWSNDVAIYFITLKL